MPPPRQLFHLLAFAAFSAWTLAGVHEAVYPNARPRFAWSAAVLRPVTWQMFATSEVTNATAEFEGEDGGGWKRLPMSDWLDAGPETSAFWRTTAFLSRPRFREPFLEMACERSGLTTVRVVTRVWEKVPGDTSRPDEPQREKVLATRTCR